jgi:hypothetical protein
MMRNRRNERRSDFLWKPLPEFAAALAAELLATLVLMTKGWC